MGFFKSVIGGIGEVFQDPKLKEATDSAESLLRCISRKDIDDRAELELMRKTLQRDYPDSYGGFRNQMEHNRLAPKREREEYALKEEIREVRKAVESLLASKEEVETSEVMQLHNRLEELTEKLDIEKSGKGSLQPGSKPKEAQSKAKVNDFFAAYGK